MIIRNNFLKTIFGIGIFIFVWAVLPQDIAGKINNKLGLIDDPNVEILEVSVPLSKTLTHEDSILTQKAIEDIKALASPLMEGRRAGTTGETRASLYLIKQLQLLNLQELGETGYFQLFTIPPMDERFIRGRALFRPSSQGLKMPSCNILAGLEGKNKDEKIILSAHFDHLGIFDSKLHAGANDNAAGVGCVLEIMRRLVKDQLNGLLPEKSVIIAFWGAEEMGYLGSRYFVTHPTVSPEQIKGVINLDSVGNGAAGDFIIWTNQDSELAKKVQKIGEEKNADMEIQGSHNRFSDELSFRGTSIPALTILSKEWLKENHTPRDDLTLINEEKLDLICDIIYELIYEL